MTSAPVSMGNTAVNLVPGGSKAASGSSGTNFRTFLNQQTAESGTSVSPQNKPSQGAKPQDGVRDEAAKAADKANAADKTNADGAKAERAEEPEGQEPDAVQDAADDEAGKTASKETQDAAEAGQEPENTQVQGTGGTSDSRDAEADGEETGDARWAALMELLGTSAQDFAQQVADTLGISREKLQGLMEELGMEPVDLLQPDSLKTLTLAAAGETDDMALLTDGDLYGKVQELNGKLAEVLEKAGVQPDQVKQMVEAAQAAEKEAVQSFAGQTAEERQPLVTVETAAAEKPPTEESVRSPEMSAPNTPEAEGKVLTAEAGAKTQERGAENGSQEPGKHNTAGEHGQNPFAQDIQQFMKAAPQQEAAGAQSAQSVWNTDTEQIMRQIMDYMKIQIKPDMSSMEMQLHPESLGRLHVQVASKEGVVTAQFVAQNEAVKNALESQMVQLRESFNEQGVKVEAIEVTVQPHAFEQNLEQGRGNSQEEPERKARTRKIDLTGLTGAEELSGEDRLTADMMAANGSTVDYMA